jgi:hypothetical protein
MTGIATPHQSTGRAAPAPTSRHDGFRAGLVGATTVWAWLFVDDLLSHVPLRTAIALGRGLLSIDRVGPSTPVWVDVVVFTLAHYALWIGVGALLTGAARRATRAPSVLLAATVVVILLQFLLVGLAAILAQRGLGALAFRDVAFGNMAGWVALLWHVVGRHRDLRDELAHAADGRDE